MSNNIYNKKTKDNALWIFRILFRCKTVTKDNVYIAKVIKVM